MSSKAIREIKAAVDAGLTVTLADSAAYTVIKDSSGLGQYLIKYSGSNYIIGLHGHEGTQYEDRINMPGDWIVSGRIKG